MNTRKIEQLMSKDFSVGTDTFREDLLQRCLGVVGERGEDRVRLSDDDLDMLAAAGTPYESLESQQKRQREGYFGEQQGSLFTPPQL